MSDDLDSLLYGNNSGASSETDFASYDGGHDESFFVSDAQLTAEKNAKERRRAAQANATVARDFAEQRQSESEALNRDDAEGGQTSAVSVSAPDDDLDLLLYGGQSLAPSEADLVSYDGGHDDSFFASDAQLTAEKDAKERKRAAEAIATIARSLEGQRRAESAEKEVEERKRAAEVIATVARTLAERRQSESETLNRIDADGGKATAVSESAPTDDLDLLLYGRQSLAPSESDLGSYEGGYDDSFFVSETQQRAEEAEERKRAKLAEANRAERMRVSRIAANRGVLEPEPIPDTDGFASSSDTGESTPIVSEQNADAFKKAYEALRMFKELLDDGIITQEEFDAVKSKNLGMLPGDPITNAPSHDSELACEESENATMESPGVVYATMDWNNGNGNYLVIHLRDTPDGEEYDYRTGLYKPPAQDAQSFCEEVALALERELGKRVEWTILEGTLPGTTGHTRIEVNRESSRAKRQNNRRRSGKTWLAGVVAAIAAIAYVAIGMSCYSSIVSFVSKTSELNYVTTFSDSYLGVINVDIGNASIDVPIHWRIEDDTKRLNVYNAVSIYPSRSGFISFALDSSFLERTKEEQEHGFDQLGNDAIKQQVINPFIEGLNRNEDSFVVDPATVTFGVNDYCIRLCFKFSVNKDRTTGVGHGEVVIDDSYMAYVAFMVPEGEAEARESEMLSVLNTLKFRGHDVPVCNRSL